MFLRQMIGEGEAGGEEEDDGEAEEKAVAACGASVGGGAC